MTDENELVRCPTCKGTGEIQADTYYIDLCEACVGSGYVKKEEAKNE